MSINLFVHDLPNYVIVGCFVELSSADVRACCLRSFMDCLGYETPAYMIGSDLLIYSRSSLVLLSGIAESEVCTPSCFLKLRYSSYPTDFTIPL